MCLCACVCVSLCVSERANLPGSLLGSESEGRVLRVTFAHRLEKEKLKKNPKKTGQQVDRSNLFGKKIPESAANLQRELLLGGICVFCHSIMI